MFKFSTPDKLGLPDVRVNKDGHALPQQHVTLPNVRYILDQLGIRLCFDMMRAEPVFKHLTIDDSPSQQEQTEALVLDMAVRLGMKGEARVRELFGVVARTDPFHPMEDWMRSAKWDGVDYIGQLTDSITTDSVLWPTYIENWLVQVVAGVCSWRNGNQSLPHVLVLVGGQGLGKTHWLGQLGNGWIKTEAELHLSSSSSKDHQISALQYPMVELSELDGIFRKSDISHMKSFISREFDEIRAPYARKAIKRPRVTSFCASVNEAEFLNDTTGSRRFWPVQVDAIDWTLAIPWEQLWAQAFSFWQDNPAFNLTPAEDEIRAAVAIEQHTVLTPEIEYLASFYSSHQHLTDSYRAMNGAEVLRMLGYKNPWVRTVSEAKKWLADMLGKHRTIDGKQRAWMFPYSDFGSDPTVWPDRNHLESVK